MTASLAERIRAIAGRRSRRSRAELRRSLAELLPIAVQVARVELALDEIAADALESANLPQHRPIRRRPHLRLVE